MEPPNTSTPDVVFVSPAEPERMAETMPDRPSNATTSLVSVPLCTVPPVNETVPVLEMRSAPRLSTPPAAIRLPVAAPNADVPPAISVPLVTVVGPE